MRLESSWHKYDIEIISLYYKIKDNNLKDKDYPNRIKSGIEIILKAYSSDVDSYFSQKTPFVLPYKHPAYEFYLALELAYADIPLIPSLLNYQKRHYDGSSVFENLVEFRSYDMVKQHSVTNTKERDDKIMQWVYKNRNIDSIVKNKKFFVWVGKEPDELRKLSRELKLRDYTYKITDFEKVFTENIPTQWRRTQEELAYLIHCLYSHSPKKINAYNRGYFSSAEDFFFDRMDNKQEKFNLKDAKYNMFVRNPQNHKKNKDTIDYILRDIFRKNL